MKHPEPLPLLPKSSDTMVYLDEVMTLIDGMGMELKGDSGDQWAMGFNNAVSIIKDQIAHLSNEPKILPSKPKSSVTVTETVDKLELMDNSTYPEHIIPGEEIIDIKIKINEIIGYLNTHAK